MLKAASTERQEDCNKENSRRNPTSHYGLPLCVYQFEDKGDYLVLNYFYNLIYRDCFYIFYFTLQKDIVPNLITTMFKIIYKRSGVKISHDAKNNCSQALIISDLTWGKFQLIANRVENVFDWSILRIIRRACYESMACGFLSMRHVLR